MDLEGGMVGGATRTTRSELNLTSLVNTPTATLSHNSSFKYHTSRQEPTPEPRTPTPGLNNVHRTLTSNPTEEQDVWVTNPDNVGGSTSIAVPDPEFPTGTWGPDDTPERLRVWDQPVAPPNVPGFSAADLNKPEVITIHDTDSEPIPPYLGSPIPRAGPRVVIPHPS